MATDNTFTEFSDKYLSGGKSQVIALGPDSTSWPYLVVQAGNKTAVLQLMNVAADNPDEQHLCIDVHSFVDYQAARGSVFGMEVGRRLEGFSDAEAAGTSHGRPAASLVAVLVGKQVDTDTRIEWSRLDRRSYLADGGAYTLRQYEATNHKPAGWYLTGSAGNPTQFMSADLTTALDRAGALIRAQAEHDTLMATGGAA